MTDSYKNLFSKAINRTIQMGFDLSIKDIRSNKKARNIYSSEENKKRVLSHLFSCFANLKAEYIDTHSVELNLRFKPYLEDYLNCPITLTIGGASKKGEAKFNFSENEPEILNDKTTPDYKRKVPHIWFTLPSLEIIDLTFLEHINNQRGLPFESRNEYEYIFDSIDSVYLKEQVTYKPVFVGIGSLTKLNLINNNNDFISEVLKNSNNKKIS